jgi:hypothetical protein
MAHATDDDSLPQARARIQRSSCDFKLFAEPHVTPVQAGDVGFESQELDPNSDLREKAGLPDRFQIA